MVHLYKRDSNGNVSKHSQIAPSTTNMRTGFGQAILFLDDFLIVGAPSEGAVYIFKRQSNDSWTELQRIENTLSDASDSFGWHIEGNGSLIIVGSRSVGVMTYTYNSFHDEFRPLLPISIPNYDGQFGYRVGILGQLRFAIQSEDYIHIIRLTQSGEWEEDQRIELPGTNIRQDDFRIATDGGGTLVLAHLASSEGAFRAGEVIVYERSSSVGFTLTETARFFAPNTDDNDSIGNTLHLNGPLLAIGNGGGSRNEVLVYRRSPNASWTNIARLPMTSGSNSNFGTNNLNVAVSDNLIVGGNTNYSINGESLFWELSNSFDYIRSVEMPNGLRADGGHPGAMKFIQPIDFLFGGQSVLVSGINSNYVPETYYTSTTGFETFIGNIAAARNGMHYLRLNNDDEISVFLSGRGEDLLAKTGLFKQDFDSYTEIETNLPNINGASAWGDLTGDGRLDLVISGADDSSINGAPKTRIFLNRGDYNFEELDISDLVDTDNGAAGAVLIGDFFNRGRNDIYLVGFNTGSIPTQYYYLQNMGDETFEVEDNALTTQTGDLVTDAKYGDINNNGFLDIVIVGNSYGYDRLGIFFNNGDGTFDYTNFGTNITVAYFDAHVQLADLSNNGYLDILFNGYNTIRAQGEFYVLRNSADGKSLQQIEINAINQGIIHAGATSHNGIMELVAMGVDNRNRSVFKVYENNIAEASYSRPTAPSS